MVNQISGGDFVQGCSLTGVIVKGVVDRHERGGFILVRVQDKSKRRKKLEYAGISCPKMSAIEIPDEEIPPRMRRFVHAMRKDLGIVTVSIRLVRSDRIRLTRSLPVSSIPGLIIQRWGTIPKPFTILVDGKRRPQNYKLKGGEFVELFEK